MGNLDIVDLILSESRNLEDFLNNNLLKLFGKMHNIKDENNLFFLKQEVVAKRAYFMDVKKKYILHIINNEGKSVDELFIRGIDTRRSEYPSLTKKRLMELIEMLVKTDKINYKQIRDFVNSTELEIKNLIKKGNKTIAKTVNFSKPLDEYSRIPPHVKGMIMWNTCMYNHFVPGVKGYSFRIKGIDEHKAPQRVLDNIRHFRDANCVVLPQEEESLPEFFEIDVDHMLDLAWGNRVKLLLSPDLDKIYPKKKENIVKWD